ncbi:hypothetical protein EYR40_000337 [Pleurotus pulmonarius]|nr:hypothetical protein EYR40_000337 [Pleurotus pulmonarius]
MPLSPTSHGNTNSRALRNQPAQYTTARRPTSRHSSAPASKNILPSLHWLFRSNIPRHRNSYIPTGVDIHKRNFFGMGEILSVLTNPAETVRSLTESKRLLEEARREIEENRERAQIRPKHTFSRLPGFFPRKAEITAIERALAGEPSFTVVFGASSVGKTALLREVLSSPKYHVLHFDLRIAGFADLGSLYQSLSQQMEQYFEEIAKQMEGYEDFEKEAWSFKHDRLNVEKRTMESQNGNGSNGKVKTSDIARLMELFQSSLLKYWEFKPEASQDDHSKSRHGADTRRQNSQETTSSHTRVGSPNDASGNSTGKKSRWNFFRSGRFKRSHKNKTNKSVVEKPREVPENEEQRTVVPDKKVPVIFFDEAHKLPALIQSSDTMKCLLDSMLVLTKQDRLCHVIHATSDPFYQTWLRQLNVMQHCKIVTIGDCSKSETRTYFRDHILPSVPAHLQPSLVFERLYEAFGGKLAHWHDYINDYGTFEPIVIGTSADWFIQSTLTVHWTQSSHFLQAHALLNLHIIHSSQSDNGVQDSKDKDRQAAGSPTSRRTNAESLHPALGPAGFKIYSPLNRPPSSLAVLNDGFAGLGMFPTSAPSNSAEFTAMHLLKVMSRITQPGNTSLPYFLLCREIGVREVDGMVKGKVLDLRWTDCVSREDRGDRRSRAMGAASGIAALGTHAGAESSGTAVELLPPPPPIIMEDSDGLVDISEREMPEPRYTAAPYSEEAYGVDGEEEEDFVVGPRLVPITPIMRFAMREVVAEYEDNQSVSEYASLSDVDEY